MGGIERTAPHIRVTPEGIKVWKEPNAYQKRAINRLMEQLFSPDNLHPDSRKKFLKNVLNRFVDFKISHPQTFPYLSRSLLVKTHEDPNIQNVAIVPYMVAIIVDIEKPDPDLILADYIGVVTTIDADTNFAKIHALSATGQILAPHFPASHAAIRKIRSVVDPLKIRVSIQPNGDRITHKFDQMLKIMTAPIITRFQENHPGEDFSLQILQRKLESWMDSSIARQLNIPVEKIAQYVDNLVSEGYLGVQKPPSGSGSKPLSERRHQTRPRTSRLAIESSGTDGLERIQIDQKRGRTHFIANAESEMPRFKDTEKLMLIRDILRGLKVVKDPIVLSELQQMLTTAMKYGSIHFNHSSRFNSETVKDELVYALQTKNSILQKPRNILALFEAATTMLPYLPYDETTTQEIVEEFTSLIDYVRDVPNGDLSIQKFYALTEKLKKNLVEK